MTSIVYSEQIIPLAKILNKDTNYITFKEIISLIFHATITIANDESEPDHLAWKEVFGEFEKELNAQNKRSWPKMSIIKNDYWKRMDIFSDDSFVVSRNFFTLLLRLLVVENYKRPYVYKCYDYHKILGYKIKVPENIVLKKISMMELYTYLKNCLLHYLRVYNNDRYFEYQLGKSILKQLQE